MSQGAVMLRLDPPIYMETPKGPGWAHVMIWMGLEASVLWTVFLEGGKVYTFPNEDIRACENYTAFRLSPEKPPQDLPEETPGEKKMGL